MSSGRKGLKLTESRHKRPTDGSCRSTYDRLRPAEDTLTPTSPCEMTSHLLKKATEDLLEPTEVISVAANGVAGDVEKNPSSSCLLCPSETGENLLNLIVLNSR